MSKEYKLIVADVRSFEPQVNRALDMGWELQGIPFYDGSRFIQAMIKEIGRHSCRTTRRTVRRIAGTSPTYRASSDLRPAG